MRPLRYLIGVCAVSVGWSVVLGSAKAAAPTAESAARIDRRALVSRHNPKITRVDPWAPLSVGNGQFCFTADVTGLQTFYEHYQKNGIGLETQARWAWHSNPNPNGYTLADANRPFTAYGKTIGYPTDQGSAAGRWLRENPHTMPLPQIALDLRRDDGRLLVPGDLSNIDQTLDLWTGIITSRYTVNGVPVQVTTACHPKRDLLAVRIESTLVANGRLGVRIAFPRGHDIKTKNNPALDWSEPQSHTTRMVTHERTIGFVHERDGSKYQAMLVSDAADTREIEPHHFRVARNGGGTRLEFTIEFAWVAFENLPIDAEKAFVDCRNFKPQFWQSGAAIDFSGSKDPRARELERRVVLSQYLTAIQLSGGFPPQETGLTLSSWYGKHHTEMIWWHAAHFALWGREEFLAKNLRWYVDALPRARELARSRELQGARWPKMIGPDWRESPGGNPLIVWNQPHPIHLAELLYRNAPTKETLERYKELVLETAAGMASMLQLGRGGAALQPRAAAVDRAGNLRSGDEHESDV